MSLISCCAFDFGDGANLDGANLVDFFAGRSVLSGSVLSTMLMKSRIDGMATYLDKAVIYVAMLSSNNFRFV